MVLAAEVKKEVATLPAKKLHVQTVDLVTGEPINKKIFTDIQGQRVYHSSQEAAQKFKADPETYFKKAAADTLLLENIQKFCPISGDDINKKHYLDYQGRRVYFCCRSCIKTFTADPATMIKRLDWPADSVKKNSLMKM